MRFPYLVLESREPSSLLQIITPLLTVSLALCAGALLLLARGVNPLIAYAAMVSGALGSGYGLSETAVKATPLLLCGLAVSLPLKAGLWNIGAEGQLHMGTFAAAWVALTLGHYPSFLLLPLLITAGFLAGAFWGMIPGFLRAKWDLNEILVSLMLNYIAINWVNYLVYGPLKDPQGFNFPLSPPFSPSAWLPRLPTTRLHAGILLALGMASLISLFLQKTRLGYEIKVTGANPQTARYGGISLMKVILVVMALGGGVAGLAGVGEVAGVQRRLRKDISAGYGYTAIPVALLGKLHPWGVVMASFLFGVLFVGGSHMQQVTGVPVALVSIIQALIVLFVVGGDTLARYRFRFRWKE